MHFQGPCCLRLYILRPYCKKFVEPKWATVICPWTRKSSVRSLLQKMVIKCFTSWLSCLQRLTKWSKYLVTLWTFIHRKCLKCLDFLKWWKDKFQMQTGLSSCRLSSWFMPSSLQILVSSFLSFGDLGCVIFFTLVSICKARQARLSKYVNKPFCNFVSQNQRITKMG